MSVGDPIDVADVLAHGAEELLPGFPQSLGIGQILDKPLARRVDNALPQLLVVSQAGGVMSKFTVVGPRRKKWNPLQ